MSSQELCRSQHTDLVSIHSAEENSAIAELAKSWEPNKVWLGLFKDTWKWSDASETSFRYWRSGLPTAGNCVSVAVSQWGRWIDVDCNQKAPFTCQGGE